MRNTLRLSLILAIVISATLVFAREKDSYSAHYRGGSLSIMPARADSRQYAWEDGARRGVRFRLGADSIVITRKKMNVVIAFKSISKITCGSDMHSAANMGQKVAMALIFGIPGVIATSGIDTEAYVGLTWGPNSETAIFQFNKKDYIPVLLALQSKSGKVPIEDYIGLRLALESKSGRLPTEAAQVVTPAASEPSPAEPSHEPRVKLAQPTDKTEVPTPKCAQGTYWGDDASGHPICSWRH